MATHRIRPDGRNRFLMLARVALLFATAMLAACDESPTSATSTNGGQSSNAGGSGGGSGGTGITTQRLTLTRFLAFGDSMTAGEVTAPASLSASLAPMVVVPSASFPSQLQDRLRARYLTQAGDIAVANGGRSSESVLAALPRLADLLANSRTEVLLLFHGSEDLLNAGAGGVNPAANAFDLLAKEGRRRNARVFIATLPPSLAGRQRSVADGAIRAYNDQVSAIARGEGAAIVDLYAALSPDVARYIGSDGLHPTELGYRRIADEFLARIAAELETR